MPDRADVVRIARSYIGTRFHHQARLKGVGIDCLGLVVCVANELGLDTSSDRRDYPRRPNGDLIPSLGGSGLILKPVNAPYVPGEIIVLRMNGLPWHCAILGDANRKTIIHAFAPRKKVIESDLGNWEGEIVARYDFPGVSGA